MPTTHCEPGGTPPTSNTIQVGSTIYGTTIPQTGTLKGVMVWITGLQDGPISVFPQPMSDTGGILPDRNLTLGNTIAATGWYVVAPQPPGYGGMVAGQNQLIYDDISTDSGNGSRWAATIGEWWDHQVWAIQKNISSTVPIVPVGFSMGGFLALHIALSRTSTIGGYVAHHPASVISDLNPAFTLVSFSGLTSTGCDVGASALNGVTTIPGLLGWGSSGGAIGVSPWTGDTLTPAMYSAAHGAGAPVSPNCDGTGTASAGSPTENHVLTSSTDHANPNNDVYQIAAWFNANLPHN